MSDFARLAYNDRTMHALGHTRSTSRPDYLLQTPDSFVRTPMPGLTNGSAIFHAAPRMGAAFAMSTIELEPGGTLNAGPAQRFLYVLEGAAWLGDDPLPPASFAYLPAGDSKILTAGARCRMILIEKPFEALNALPAPVAFTGAELNIDAASLNGDDDLQVRCLVPADARFDFAVNTMTYAPGAALSHVEVHYMEHGLLMLEGGGIYRLGDDWHPVTAGDFIWMGPFCPQWFAAIGKVPAKYIIYKNFNRHVLA